MSLVTGNIYKDFFDQNSALSVKSEFKTLIEETSKEEASKIMWAIYLIEDFESPFYRMPREERIKEIQSEFYPLDVKGYKWIMDAYARLTMSKEEAMFKVHSDSLDEITSHLKDLSVHDDKQFNKKLKIMEKLPKMWDGYEKVKTRMIDSKRKTNIKGGAKESFAEQRSRK